jgi:hypothetical protein
MKKDEKNILSISAVHLAACGQFLPLIDLYSFYEVIALHKDNRTKSMQDKLKLYFFKSCQKRILNDKLSDYIIRSDEKGDTKMPKNVFQIVKFQQGPYYHTFVLYENKRCEIFGCFDDIESKEKYTKSHEDLKNNITHLSIPQIWGIKYTKNKENTKASINVDLVGTDLQIHSLRLSKYQIGCVDMTAQKFSLTSEYKKIIGFRNFTGFLSRETKRMLIISRLMFDKDYKLLETRQKYILKENIQDTFDADVDPDDHTDDDDLLEQYIKY